MPRRSSLSIDQVADLRTLTLAFWQAARGKRHRDEVRPFAEDLDASLGRLRDDLHAGRSPQGQWAVFRVFDPKPRRILAPCFADRVLHHALMSHMGPVLERALVDDTFACRLGKGTLAAVHRAQQHARRFPWFVKVDVRAFFASIDHAILHEILRRRFKNAGLLALCARILSCTPDPPGTGLPIGALTSQHFANTYLDALDRHLLESLHVRGMVRYMDDVVWFTESKAEARRTLAQARTFLLHTRRLEIKPDARVGRSADGFGFLGFHVRLGTLRLSLRRKRRYALARRRSEAELAAGLIGGVELQARYAAALGITAHADAAGFRAAELTRRPPLDA